jgi:hypothetical protein
LQVVYKVFVDRGIEVILLVNDVRSIDARKSGILEKFQLEGVPNKETLSA